jgi:hypothetical protein
MPCIAHAAISHTISHTCILHNHYLLHTTAAATVLTGHFSSHRTHYTHYTSPFPLTPLQQSQHQRGTYLNSGGRGPMNPVASP